MQSLEDKYKAEVRRLGIEARALKAEIMPIQQKLNVIQKNLEESRAQLSRARFTPSVTDHAVIRYLERVYGFDFEKQREELLTDSVRAAMKLGAEKVKRGDCTLVLNGNRIVTVTN